MNVNPFGLNSIYKNNLPSTNINQSCDLYFGADSGGYDCYQSSVPKKKENLWQKWKKWIIGGTVAVGVGVLGIVGYNKGWFSKAKEAAKTLPKVNKPKNEFETALKALKLENFKTSDGKDIETLLQQNNKIVTEKQFIAVAQKLNEKVRQVTLSNEMKTAAVKILEQLRKNLAEDVKLKGWDKSVEITSVNVLDKVIKKLESGQPLADNSETLSQSSESSLVVEISGSNSDPNNSTTAPKPSLVVPKEIPIVPVVKVDEEKKKENITEEYPTEPIIIYEQDPQKIQEIENKIIALLKLKTDDDDDILINSLEDINNKDYYDIYDMLEKSVFTKIDKDNIDELFNVQTTEKNLKLKALFIETLINDKSKDEIESWCDNFFEIIKDETVLTADNIEYIANVCSSILESKKLKSSNKLKSHVQDCFDIISKQNLLNENNVENIAEAVSLTIENEYLQKAMPKKLQSFVEYLLDTCQNQNLLNKNNVDCIAKILGAAIKDQSLQETMPEKFQSFVEYFFNTCQESEFFNMEPDEDIDEDIDFVDDSSSETYSTSSIRYAAYVLAAAMKNENLQKNIPEKLQNFAEYFFNNCKEPEFINENTFYAISFALEAVLKNTKSSELSNWVSNLFNSYIELDQFLGEKSIERISEILKTSINKKILTFDSIEQLFNEKTKNNPTDKYTLLNKIIDYDYFKSEYPTELKQCMKNLLQTYKDIPSHKLANSDIQAVSEILTISIDKEVLEVNDIKKLLDEETNENNLKFKITVLNSIINSRLKNDKIFEDELNKEYFKDVEINFNSCSINNVYNALKKQIKQKNKTPDASNNVEPKSDNDDFNLEHEDFFPDEPEVITHSNLPPGWNLDCGPCGDDSDDEDSDDIFF